MFASAEKLTEPLRPLLALASATPKRWSAAVNRGGEQPDRLAQLGEERAVREEGTTRQRNPTRSRRSNSRARSESLSTAYCTHSLPAPSRRGHTESLSP